MCHNNHLSCILFWNVAFFIFISYLDRGTSTLYCSSRNLLEATFDVTSFCVIDGIVASYVLYA